MAGQGTRFKEEGYLMDKCQILFRGKTLFEWSMTSLRNFRDLEFIFVARQTPHIVDFIEEGCRRLGLRHIHIKLLESVTRGQAETALMAGGFFHEDESFAIFNIDTYVQPSQLNLRFIRGNGWIPVFYAPGDRWSFVETVDDMALRTAEKTRISDKCSVGFYYFDSFAKFRSIIAARTSSNVEGELYVAPLYNDLIRGGNKVYVHEIPSQSVVVLGTPGDLRKAGSRYDDGDWPF